MTHKYERQCWSCGSKDMEPDAQGVRCRSCGATWNPVPAPGPDPLAPHGFYLEDDKGRKLGRMLRPSNSVKRRAARTREKSK